MINIIVDTNLLKSGSTDFTCVQFVDKITSIIDELESNDLYDRVQILIPQIVIDELYEHQIKSHSERYSAIKSCKFPNFNIVPCENYGDFLKGKIDVAIKELAVRDAKCVVLPYPDNNVLEGIIKRALAKRPPFEGKDKESDKGFKDVIIWESVIAYKKAYASDVIILCSRDGRLCDNLLKEEFRDLFDEEIHLLKLDANNYQPLYDKLGELTKHQLKPTFDEKLRRDALGLLNWDNLHELYVGENFENPDGVLRCDDISISDKRIIVINSVSGDKNLIYIEAEAFIHVISYDVEYNDVRLFKFEIEYSLNEESFFLVGYDSFNGYLNIRERNFVLE